MNNSCLKCGGSGWISAAREMGMEDAPSCLQPFGISPCWSCRGRPLDFSKAFDGLTEEQQALVNKTAESLRAGRDPRNLRETDKDLF